MKKSILVFLVSLFLSFQALAKVNAFVVSENHHILKKEGNIEERHSPCSSFKIAISLMGFNEKILTSESTPIWPYSEGRSTLVEACKFPQTPASWLKNSCLWYSQDITAKLGADKFQTYANQFNYGNQDVSGDKDKHNGLTDSWIMSSLKISPREQVEFLEKLVDNQLPISHQAVEYTKHVLYLETLSNGWKLYGKTGSGNVVKRDGSIDKDHHAGWFVGWLEKGNRKIVFAEYLQDTQKLDMYSGRRAKVLAKENLMKFIRSEDHERAA